MKKVLKWTGISLSVLLIGLALFGWWMNEPRPRGLPAAEADELAFKMLRAVDKSAWDTTRFLQWSFPGGHDYLWDKSRDLVAELIGGLDPSQQPELVEQLKALFVFVYENLNHADMKQDARYIHDAIKVLSIHREGWCELIEQLQSSTPEEKKTVHSQEPLKRPHHIEHSEQAHQSRSWLT